MYVRTPGQQGIVVPTPIALIGSANGTIANAGHCSDLALLDSTYQVDGVRFVSRPGGERTSS